MKRLFVAGLILLGLSLWVLAAPGLGWVQGAGARASFDRIAINLRVNPLRQAELTSCGEAVITMAYNYAYPQTPIYERDVIVYARLQGYYSEYDAPFTSPENMVKITRHYTPNFSTGMVNNSTEGLALLVSSLQKGVPVMIDVVTHLDDRYSPAHFILVTGIAVASDNPYAVAIFYNDPLTGRTSVSPWLGDNGIWNAWSTNDDPGGPGWWLSIQPGAR